jgi:ATP-dependent Lhr-like helicase
MPLSTFSPPTRTWFTEAFGNPTLVQEKGWPAIARGEHALLLAPTGSGKTLAAFLACLDRLSRLPEEAEPGTRVLYISPLKALAYDIERNLRAPLVGIERVAQRLGVHNRPIRVDVRTGDTPQSDRARQKKNPGDILVTTPESLFLLLGSQARKNLTSVETVIVDEIHAVADSKRGVHLALSLERLSHLVTGAGNPDPQRVGLSATQRPLDLIARFLGGPRTVSIVDAAAPPNLSLQVVVPVADMEQPIVEASQGGPVLGEPKRRVQPSIWPTVHPKLLELIRAHKSTIIFVNSRLLCERLAQNLNELAGEDLVKAHHGSIARHQREVVEQMLKTGSLPALVATSSLELGIDMGAVDLVVQVASPGSVARGLQRVGRAGHGVGEVSEGRIFPKFRGDLVEAAVVSEAMLAGRIESTHVPRNCLDVLAQQVVGMCATDAWALDDLYEVVRQAFPYAELTRNALVSVLDMLAGRYPSDELSDLRPRINWDRTTDTLQARRGAGMLALLNAGTIPDRGLYAVHLGPDGPRIGEADEEMVHERRRGQNIILGASTWRIEEITRDRVIVSPAPGEPGLLPFWKGEAMGRPAELGRELGAWVGKVGAMSPEDGQAWLLDNTPLDAYAAGNVVTYLAEQKQATAVVPSDTCLVIEQFRDELGDWRLCILSPYGARVHAPWALALESLLVAREGFAVQTLWSDDGIVLRFADGEALPDRDLLVPDPSEVEDLLVEQLRHSALFAARFRENAGRALLLPKRHPKKRTPLWQQRLRAQNLLAVTGHFPAFPIVLETYRECLQDVFDLPGLVELLGRIQRREVRVEHLETPRASPFARSLVFAFVAAYLYEGDAPLAERKAQALTLDRDLLRELLGQEELRDLLDPEALDEVEAELQGLAEGWRARNPDGLHDLLRRVGDLSLIEIVARCEEDPAAWLAELGAQRRAVEVRFSGEARWIAVEDAGRFRDALGVTIPPGLPAVFVEPVERPLERLLYRYARSHGPFLSGTVARRYGLLPALVLPALRALEAEGRMVHGELRPGGTEREWCHPEVLRRLRRRSLARLRREVAPVDAAVLGRFLPGWHGLGTRRGGMGRLQEVIDQLEGLAIPVSVLEKEVLPARIPDFQPRMLDQLGAAGEVVWIGRGALGSRDGRVALFRRERAPLLVDPPEPPEASSPLHQAILDHLDSRGASFLVALQTACGTPSTEELVAALWDLVWAGWVTNDTFLPLRGLRSRPRRVRAGRTDAARTAGGRWSLVAELLEPVPSDTQRLYARAAMLLERYGVVSREAAHAEGLPGGFAGMYPVLSAMEESGKVRRGWFVEGLGGAQFARPGVVDRIRGHRTDSPQVRVLAATDPANPYGAILPWPVEGTGPRPRRVVGARVVLVDGVPVLFVDRGGKSVVTLDRWDDPELARRAVGALEALRGGRYRSLRIDRIDGEPALESSHAGVFLGAGFAEDYRGLCLDAHRP